MEFPTAGKHCAQENCNLLDFLPFTCGQCEKVTCLEHKDYAAHDCPEAYKLDVKVPVCQLCNSPVPTRKGEDPNIIMSNHIDQGCREIEISKKTYTNSCMFKNCKKREAVPIACRTCRMNYCMKHRLENSHACEAPKKDAPRSRTGLAAADRARINQEGKPDSKERNCVVS
ncbi:hypothetical protein SARC_06966 [Sphaeroforma arctica JP610]|uniref:AN1-type domain-containing protein n=1 Tax=Sphaeroforma arctica JP610 TaxID=667725 RepID=A0A0L0FV24_9EUKA|nr:hypothetical protein SARC_06966 [Sphaeroforma arctica JP610]KNC80677.1 hypothetical protein SARC_06966 [Sphaeroforma arctica JP610]|eukprot:XP_014154579.1 hypothetical protein SARC_06966 [Sphaeroforma arctica JP610]